MTAEGDIETPLDEEQVRKATARLRALGVTSIAISFLHSYLNRAHELRAREVVLEEYPDVEMISLSHEVLPNRRSSSGRRRLSSMPMSDRRSRGT